jgi:membrane-bound lytic murein transglycosylase MltF
MWTNVSANHRRNDFSIAQVTLARLILIVIALSISLCSGVFAAEVATPAAPLRLEARINGERWTGDLDGIAKRRILRILIVPSALGFYFNGSEMQGAMFELTRHLETALNKKLKTRNLPINVVFIPVAREDMLSKLAAGYADIAGTIAERDQAAQVDYTEPLFPDAEGVVVTGPAAPPVNRLEDLSGQELYAQENTAIWDKLVELNEQFRKAGKAPVKLVPADERLIEDDIAQAVNAGLVPATVRWDKIADAWSKVLPHLTVHHDVVVGKAPLCWAVQRNTPQLKAALNDFIKSHRAGTSYGNTVLRRYFQDTKWVEAATSREDLKRFNEMVILFQKYGNQYDYPYLMLAAQAYQESRLNQRLRSRAGAVGVMQIKPSTAAQSPINIRGVNQVDRNIEAGTKFMHFMETQYFENEPMDDVTKSLFAIASYNAGPEKVQTLRKEAAEHGYDRNLWFNNVEIIASVEIGRETVEYVGNIYRYYLAYKMLVERQAKSTLIVHKIEAKKSSGLGGDNRHSLQVPRTATR